MMLLEMVDRLDFCAGCYLLYLDGIKGSSSPLKITSICRLSPLYVDVMYRQGTGCAWSWYFLVVSSVTVVFSAVEVVLELICPQVSIPLLFQAEEGVVGGVPGNAAACVLTSACPTNPNTGVFFIPKLTSVFVCVVLELRHQGRSVLPDYCRGWANRDSRFVYLYTGCVCLLILCVILQICSDDTIETLGPLGVFVFRWESAVSAHLC
ncbi:unnamed protein product [Ectocarpus sp. 4 AP-2014]